MNYPWNKVHHCDVLEGLGSIEDNSADIVLIDPPYNIGVDFGNSKYKKDIDEYARWAGEWVSESERILKDSGTLFIYGFSEILAHISVNLDIQHRWLVWHYTNKTTPSAKFWQRSHESIICAWKDSKERIFNLDDVREPYTKTFLKNAAGKKRKATKGRFSSGEKETVYAAHASGALPRDVIKLPALAGGAGASTRIGFCEGCDMSLIGKKEFGEHEEHSVIKHPTQKPFNLTEKLILSCKPEKEGKIVVPFAGSGSEIFIAKQLGLCYIGFDLNEQYVRMANKLTEKDNAKYVSWNYLGE
jgi:site-specific DNA-methyltransferase (adenine-specific)